MPYTVKEIFYTIQGEGANVGRPAVFCRFSDCNLWTGRESDRSKAVCRFCDTDFVGVDGPGGGVFADESALAATVARCWSDSTGLASRRFVVCTGGEPLLQLDERVVHALHEAGFEIAIETNGTLLPPRGIDWICCSPKAGAKLILEAGNELKLVFPQPRIDPADLVKLDFRHFFLQPMDGPDRTRNTQLALEYCLKHPHWRLSLQIHKFLGIP